MQAPPAYDETVAIGDPSVPLRIVHGSFTLQGFLNHRSVLPPLKKDFVSMHQHFKRTILQSTKKTLMFGLGSVRHVQFCQIHDPDNFDRESALLISPHLIALAVKIVCKHVVQCNMIIKGNQLPMLR